MSTVFRKVWKLVDFSIHFGIIFDHFRHYFSILFRHRILNTFLDAIFSIFMRKWSPKWSSRVGWVAHFLLHFRDLFRRFIFLCILVARWLTFGTLLAPIGSLLVPFGSLSLAPGGPFSHVWVSGFPCCYFFVVFWWQPYAKSFLKNVIGNQVVDQVALSRRLLHVTQ